MQLIHSSALYFLRHTSANSSCVILPLFPTNKISIYLIKFCTAACKSVTVSTVENLHKYKHYLKYSSIIVAARFWLYFSTSSKQTSSVLFSGLRNSSAPYKYLILPSSLYLKKTQNSKTLLLSPTYYLNLYPWNKLLSLASSIRYTGLQRWSMNHNKNHHMILLAHVVKHFYWTDE